MINRPRIFTLDDMPQPVLNEHGFHGQDILSVNQFSMESLEYIFDVAEEMRTMVEQQGGAELLKGRVLSCLFFEPSTRTSSSFIAAMERLGGSVIPRSEERRVGKECRSRWSSHH